MRMTPKEYQDYQEAQRARRCRPPARHKPMVMNKLESDYASYLEAEKRGGMILDYQFERLKFRLADKTFYTPDFVVITKAGVEIHEVKGFWEDDAKVKIRVCADQNWWFRFLGVKKEKGQWVFEEF